jgi:RHS repeat-associated protein
VQVPNSTSINITGSLTLEAWIKPNSTGTYQNIIARESWNQSGTGGGYQLSLTNLGKVRLDLYQSHNTYTPAIGNTTVSTGAWHHVAAVFDGSQTRIYLDGVLDGNVSSTSAPASGTSSLKIGRASYGDYFNGLIDEARVSNAAIYTSNFTPQTHLTASGSTKGLWTFDCQTPNDSSGNANNGTLQGGAVYASDVPGGGGGGSCGGGGGGGSSANIRWLVTDHLGTPRMIFDQTGDLTVLDQNGNYVRGVTRHDYLPFGEELFAGTGGRTTAQGYTANDGVRQKFTQKERDNETGLDFSEARYFSSMQGRFTSADPINTVIAERVVDPQQINLYSYVRNNPLKYIDSTGMKIDPGRLDEDRRKQWDEIVKLANAKDELGGYVNPELQATYQRLEGDERTFFIENHSFGDKSGTIGEFTITKFSGEDFTEAVIQLDFNKVKNLSGPQDVDMLVPGFKKFEGLFGMKNDVVLRLAELFGHEGAHGVAALNNPAEAAKLQGILNDRDAALNSLPKGTKYPYPPDVMQKMEAATKGLGPTELFAQQTEQRINRELNPKLRGAKCKKR